MKALALSSVLGGGPGQRLQIQTSHGLRGYSAKVRLWSCRRQGPHSGGCADRRGDQLRFATGCPGRDVPREFIGQGMTLAPTLSNNMSEQVGTDRALIDQARAGDEAALRTLIERYEPQVAATVVGMLGPGDEADDMGQETFVPLLPIAGQVSRRRGAEHLFDPHCHQPLAQRARAPQAAALALLEPRRPNRLRPSRASMAATNRPQASERKQCRRPSISSSQPSERWCCCG